MTRTYNTFLFAVALLLVKACSGYFPYSRELQNYDVGCYKKISDFYSSNDWQAFANIVIPDCKTGGIFRNVQCSFSAQPPCYCAYYDTGNKIADLPQLYDYRQLRRKCPIRTEIKTNYCSVPQLHYQCTVTEKKYVYNPRTGACEAKEFGCRGHKTLKLCEEKCVPKVYDKCSFAVSEGRWCSLPSEIRYRHNTKNGACETFFYKGCAGNSNNYKYLWQCKKSCVKQVAVEFQVEVDFYMTYSVTALGWILEKFDLKEKDVNLITNEKWDLLRAHNISFKLVDDNAGSVDRSLNVGSNSDHNNNRRIRNDIKNNCFVAADTGPCRALITRWYFNRTESQCQTFIYGGCLPNKNNYETDGECKEYCNPLNPPRPEDLTSNFPQPGAGNNPEGEDVYLETGATVVYRLQPAPTTRASTSRDPYARNFLLSEGPSGEGST